MFDRVSDLEELMRQRTLELRASEARFHNIVSISTDGILIVDGSGSIIFTNPAAASLFGRKVEKLLGAQFGFPIVAGETTELDIHGGDGKPRIAEMRVVGTEWDGRAAHLATLRDITERRSAEQEFRKLYRAVMQSPASIIITDTKGAIEYVNPKFTETTGYLAAEVLGKSPAILKSGQTPAEVFQGMWEAITGGQPWHGEFINRKKSGEYYYEAASVAPVTDLDGIITHFVAVMEDVTERKKAEQEVRRLNAEVAARASELEAANRELEAFNYSVAHDLRQPLNIINGYCQGIKMLCGDQLGAECHELLQQAYNGTLRMSRLIDALLHFSRLGHVEPRRELIDLSGLVHGVAEELMLAHPERQVDFRIADGIMAMGDANLLRVAFVNLLGNAWKYSATAEKSIIEFGVKEIEGVPTYFVRDNGAGFDMADAHKLFIPFQRLPGAEHIRGFGIGLATVERVIQRHGGKIWAEGAPGKGACFYFTLSETGVSKKVGTSQEKA
jgi:PAS domain S-box-containing protein